MEEECWGQFDLLEEGEEYEDEEINCAGCNKAIGFDEDAISAVGCNKAIGFDEDAISAVGCNEWLRRGRYLGGRRYCPRRSRLQQGYWLRRGRYIGGRMQQGYWLRRGRYIGGRRCCH